MKLLTRLLLILAALTPSIGYAQAWGPDGAQPVVYPTVDAAGDLTAIANGTSPVVVGDGSNAWGGTPPYNAYEPADIPNPVVYANGLSGTPSTGGTERKARFICEVSHIGRNDAIRGFGQAIFGHPHVFSGNSGTNGSSTFTSLRNEPGDPTCPGNGLNNSAYWAIGVEKANALGDGITRIKKPDIINLYYVTQTGGNYVNKFQGLARGIAEITGMDLDDPDGTAPGGRLAEVAAANAVNIFGSYSNVSVNARWYCDDTGANAAYLANSSGADALSNCPSTSQISARVSGHHCWDGHNASSPTGRGHVRPYMRETSNATTTVCPLNWFYKPAIEIRWIFSHLGAADYTTWTCGSDAIAAAAAGRAMGRCESFHVDVIFAWDQRAMDEIQSFCFEAEGSTFGATCDNSSLSNVNKLDQTGINISNRYYGDQASHWFDVPPSGSVSGPYPKARVRLRTGS